MNLRLQSGHPRLYITPSELPRFKRLSLGPRKRHRKLLLEKLKPLLESPLALRGRIHHGPEYMALALGQAWRLTGDKRYGIAARWLLESLEHCVHNEPTGYDTWGVVAEAAGILYDWLHDYWRAEDMEETAARSALFCARQSFEYLRRVYILDDWHNYNLGLQTGALAGALAVGHDHPKLEDGSLLREIHALHFTGLKVDGHFLQDAYQVPPTVRCLDTALRAGGGAGFAAHAEATGAYHSVDGWELVKMASFWTSALLPKSRSNKIVWPEVARVGESLLHFTRPDGCNTLLGDSTPYNAIRGTRTANILLHLQARTPQPGFEAWLAGHADDASVPYPIHLLLCGRKFRRPKHPVQLSPAKFFDPLAVMRSGWNADATMVTFRCGRHGGWHNHFDHNSFTIFRGGPLALDSGGLDYRSPHRPEYAMRTVAHNAILVRNPAEKAWVGRFGKPTVNDGGQRLVTIGFNPPSNHTGNPHAILTEERRARFADEFDMGRLVAFEPNVKADYVAGDATRAYTYPWSGLGDNPSRRVEEAVRQLVFLKPDLVVIFDRVEATRATYEKSWLLHLLDAPVSHTRQGSAKAARGVQKLPPDGVLEAAAGAGRLTVWPLLPVERKIRTIGGKDFESWVEDPARPGHGVNFPAPRQKETGAWRVEIAPVRKSVRDCFLTVLHAGLTREAPARRSIRCAVREENGVANLHVYRQHHRAWHPWACVRFTMKGPVEVEYHFQGEEACHRAPAPQRVPQARA